MHKARQVRRALLVLRDRRVMLDLKVPRGRRVMLATLGRRALLVLRVRPAPRAPKAHRDRSRL